MAMKLTFRKYFHSVLDPEEFSRLENYLKTAENDREIFRLMKIHWDETWEGTWEGARVNPELFKKIGEGIEAERQKRIRRRLRAYTWSFRAAAILVLVLIISSIFYLQTRQDRLAEQWHTITTPMGAKTKIILPDSTGIWLNAGSSLKYSNEYGHRNRQVHLSGEAFFDVYQNPSILFQVKTSELLIKSYGTAFNVKSYPDEGTIEATLIEGSIGIKRTSIDHRIKDEVMLEPNQRVVYYRRNNTMETEQARSVSENTPVPSAPEPEKQKTTYLISKGIDAREYTSWKDGTFYISGETLTDLAVKLERKYDVRIHFENEDLKNLRFTGSLQDETVEQVIHAIGMAANIDYEIEDRDIWLKDQP